MRVIYTTVLSSVALTLWSCGSAAAQQPNPQPTNPAQTPQANVQTGNMERIDQLWKQIGDLHKQIVALEVGYSPGARTEAQPGEAARTGDTARADTQRPGADQPRTSAATPGRDFDALWKQVAQVHRQLVAMEAGTGSQARASAAPPATSATNPPAGGVPKSDRDRTGSTSNPQGGPDNPLLRQYAELHLQIIRQDVRAAKPSSPTSPEPGRRTGG